jgi:uncharacterized protein (DUF1684 family)
VVFLIFLIFGFTDDADERAMAEHDDSNDYLMMDETNQRVANEVEEEAVREREEMEDLANYDPRGEWCRGCGYGR